MLLGLIASFLPYRFVSCIRVLPTLLFTISSSSIDSPCDSCLACLLPTVHLGNALYLNRSYTLLGSSWQQAKGFALEHFTILHFLPRMIAYTAKQLYQQASGDRIRIHSQLEYGSGPTFLGRSRMLQSSYTSRCLADRIRIIVG